MSAAEARVQQQTRRPPLLLSIDWTDRRTDGGRDGQTPDRYIDLRVLWCSVVISVCACVYGGDCKLVVRTGALPAIKPEATAIGIIARWPLEKNLNVSWAQVLHADI